MHLLKQIAVNFEIFFVKHVGSIIIVLYMIVVALYVQNMRILINIATLFLRGTRELKQPSKLSVAISEDETLEQVFN